MKYRTITEYTVLPPRVRIVYSEVDPVRRCMMEADELLRPQGVGDPSNTAPGDIASIVFTAQATQRDASSKNLARLIAERMTLADRHIDEIKDRIWQLKRTIPLRSAFCINDGSLMDAERQVLDLEKQKRDVQAKLWSDVLDLRKELLGERSEYQGARRRFSFFAGGYDGAVR